MSLLAHLDTSHLLPISCHLIFHFIKFSLIGLETLELETKDVANQGLHVYFQLQKLHLKCLRYHSRGHMLHYLECRRLQYLLLNNASLRPRDRLGRILGLENEVFVVAIVAELRAILLEHVVAHRSLLLLQEAHK